MVVLPDDFHAASADMTERLDQEDS